MTFGDKMEEDNPFRDNASTSRPGSRQHVEPLVPNTAPLTLPSTNKTLKATVESIFDKEIDRIALGPFYETTEALIEKEVREMMQSDRLTEMVGDSLKRIVSEEVQHWTRDPRYESMIVEKIGKVAREREFRDLVKRKFSEMLEAEIKEWVQNHVEIIVKRLVGNKE